MAEDTPEIEEEQTDAPPLDGQQPDDGQPPDELEQPVAGGQGDEDAAAALEEARANEVAFSWQASEYVHHHKSASWYLALFGGVAALVAATALLRSWLEMGAILVMTGAIVVYARKPPRTLAYELTPKEVVIDGRKFPFEDFRSFGVMEDEEWHAVDLEPVGRLRPRMTLLFNTEDLDAIVGHLELHLPREDREPDSIEKLTRYLRF